MCPFPRAHPSASAPARAVLLAAVLLPACDADGTAPTGNPAFTLEVSGEQLTVEVTTEEQVQELEARRSAGTEGVILGALVPGDGGVNSPWSWHMDPSTVHTADLAVEVCDGRPSMVENDLDYWLGTVGQFCPWGARVVGRIR